MAAALYTAVLLLALRSPDIEVVKSLNVNHYQWGVNMETKYNLDNEFAALVAGIEPLESLDAAWNWGEFFGGVAIGVGGAGVVAGGIGIGVAIT